MKTESINSSFEVRLLLYVTETFPDLWQIVFNVKSHDDVRFNIYSGTFSVCTFSPQNYIANELL